MDSESDLLWTVHCRGHRMLIDLYHKFTLFFSFFIKLILWNLQLYTVYISRDGIDSGNSRCNASHPCSVLGFSVDVHLIPCWLYLFTPFEGGTLFHVSELINGLSARSITITIIDGQNVDSIANHSNSEYHPCLPMPIDIDKEVNIMFTFNITSFVDWFPPICTNYRNIVNQYMFDGARRWNIQNLRVENYVVNKRHGYGLARCSKMDGDIMCTHCHFKSITNNRFERPLFLTRGSLHFSAINLIDITTNSPIFLANHPAGRDHTGVMREFVLTDCIISNVTIYDQLIELSGSWNDVECTLLIICRKWNFVSLDTP